MIKKNLIRTLLLLSLAISASSLAAPLKPRVVVLTDISTWETDDHESLIRFLAHADMFEIEGLVSKRSGDTVTYSCISDGAG